MKISIYTCLIYLLSIAYGVAGNEFNNTDNNKGTVKGKILTADNKPAEFVNVVLKDTKYAAITNEKGEYSIKAPEGKYQLMVTMVGSQSEETVIEIKAGQSIEIAALNLKETSQQLNEVLVSQRKEVSYVDKLPAQTSRMGLESRDNPQSVQVLTKDILDDRQIHTVNEATRVMVGVNAFSSSEYTDYVMRGFRTNPGNFAYNSIRGDFYLFDQATRTYNIEKIEAIKGPASVLFSAGNPGGVINHITKRAQAKV